MSAALGTLADYYQPFNRADAEWYLDMKLRISTYLPIKPIIRPSSCEGFYAVSFIRSNSVIHTLLKIDSESRCYMYGGSSVPYTYCGSFNTIDEMIQHYTFVSPTSSSLHSVSFVADCSATQSIEDPGHVAHVPHVPVIATCGPDPVNTSSACSLDPRE